MNVLAALLPRRSEARSDWPALPFGDWLELWNNPMNLLFSQTLKGNQETLESSFKGYIAGAYKMSGPVFAAELTRMMLFSEARIMWRDIVDGRPGDLSWTPELEIFRRPWRGGTTGDLLARSLLDADLGGNSYTTIRGSGARRRFKRLRPDWVSIVIGVDGAGDPDADPVADLDGEVIGYLYHPGGLYSGNEPVILLPDEVAHFAPVPDPDAQYRGMSWLTPVLREIMADKSATLHKLKFFENGATPNMVVTLDKDIDPDEAKQWLEYFKENYSSAANAYKTLYLAGGADVEVVGSNFQQLDFKVTQGHGETRILMASGVHPVVVGSSEGLQGSSLNAGNYAQAKRKVGDATLRPLWRSWCGSFETLVQPPPNKELWYDDSDIKFLAEDLMDSAEIQSRKAQTITGLIKDGFTPDSAVEAVINDDFTLLEHTGKLSVQLQPSDGATEPSPESEGDANDDQNA